MLEGWADNISQEQFIHALKNGVYESFRIVREMMQEAPSIPKIELDPDLKLEDGKLRDIEANFERLLTEIYENTKLDKLSRDDKIQIVKSDAIREARSKVDEKFANELPDWFDKFQIAVFRKLLLNSPIRCDGRTETQVRDINTEVNLFRTLHGSSMFQRGQTQVLCTLTMDSVDTMYKSDKIIDMVSPSLTNYDKNFMLHYEFPPYATNEIGRVNAPVNRREVGHGALAEKAIYPVIPKDLPYTIRLLCEVLESNGSSSMAR
jgi:polyribonucleotide nucleotidyltransferase